VFAAYVFDEMKDAERSGDRVRIDACLCVFAAVFRRRERDVRMYVFVASVCRVVTAGGRVAGLRRRLHGRRLAVAGAEQLPARAERETHDDGPALRTFEV